MSIPNSSPFPFPFPFPPYTFSLFRDVLRLRWEEEEKLEEEDLQIGLESRRREIHWDRDLGSFPFPSFFLSANRGRIS